MNRIMIPLILLALSAVCYQSSADEVEARAYHKYFEYFLGEWSVTVEGDDEASGSWTVKMSPAGCSHTAVLELGDDIGHGVYGYDPVSGSWLGTGFSTKAGRWIEALKKTDADSPRPGDVIDYSGKTIANHGTERLAKMHLKVIDQSAFTVTQTILTVKGDTEPTVRTLTVKRK